MNRTGHKDAIFLSTFYAECMVSLFFFFQAETLELCQILGLFCARGECQSGVSTCQRVIQDSDRDASVIKAFLMFLSHKWLSRR